MWEMLVLIKNFLGGAACGAMIALGFALFKNMVTFKKEEKLQASQILIWVIIGFLVGGSLGAVYFTWV